MSKMVSLQCLILAMVTDNKEENFIKDIAVKVTKERPNSPHPSRTEEDEQYRSWVFECHHPERCWR
jgi:hypothetical protein